jgi:hypothetical protein
MTVEEIARFEQEKEEARQAWRRWSAKRTPPSPKSLLRKDIYKKINTCCSIVLFVPALPVRWLFDCLRLSVLCFVGSRIGSWEIPEFDEKWEVMDRGNGKPLYDTFQCSFCGDVGGLTNGGVRPCPHCRQETLYLLEDYDCILKNGRKVLARFHAGCG